jgi:hypothetical protein
MNEIFAYPLTVLSRAQTSPKSETHHKRKLEKHTPDSFIIAVNKLQK